jgi:CBS domain containing-hemolysin-like protein
MEIAITTAVISLAAMIFLATVDTAFSYISDVGLRRITAEDEDAEPRGSVEFLREIIENRQRFRFALSSTIQILLVVFVVILTFIVSEFVDGRAEVLLVSIGIGLAATVLFRQIVPRVFVRNEPERKLLFLLPAIRPLYRLASVFAGPIADESRKKDAGSLETTILSEDRDERSDDDIDDFQALMEVGEAEGIIEEDERELIETLYEFTDTRVGEIMTPRTEIVAIPARSTIRQARDLIIEQKYSRMPVYTDTIDNIDGMIYVRDLLQAWADGKEDMRVELVLRPAFFVPETKSVSELLKSMQQNHVQIAAVIDEYGGVAGVITVEDIIEEIVGEIEDEDTTTEEILEIIEGDGTYYDVLGSTEIDKIERLFDLELEDDDYTTIAGMITSETGHVPKTGERLTIRGLDIEILQRDKKRVILVRIRRAENAAMPD